MCLKRALTIAKKYSYFDPILTRNRRAVENLQLDSSGSPFKERIKSEWLYANVTNRDRNVHVYEKCDFQKIFEAVVGHGERIPFGIAEVYTDTNKDYVNDSPYFNFLTQTVMRSTMIVSKNDATKYFLHWQRMRNLWWKKVSSFPGRFNLGEIRKKSDEDVAVDILAKYERGSQIVESISMSSFSTDANVKSWMKVTNELILEAAIVGLYFDAFHEDTKNNVVLKLNTSICPFKCIFAVRGNVENMENLTQLAFHLGKHLKKLNITTILLQDFQSTPFEEQLSNNDAWGIPYTVILNETSLRTGVVYLRNRDTALEEEVHISDLTSYITSLFKRADSKMLN